MEPPKDLFTVPLAESVQFARERISYLEKEIAKLKTFIAVASELTGNEPRPKRSPTPVILDTAEAILAEAGRPMTNQEIYRELVARGVKISGREPVHNMTAKFSLRRETLIFDRELKRWRLKDES